MTVRNESRPLAAAYEAAAARLADEVRFAPRQVPVRLAKPTSNLFRPREDGDRVRLDVTRFSGVLDVDPVGRTANVLGMTTYEDLVAACLPHGLMPLVVPQLKTITLGGAVTGLGVESSSFRAGLPHESVLDMDILTGDGRLVTAGPQGEHADLFFGFPNSYGTLGYALRLTIELTPVLPFVALRHLRFADPGEAFAVMATVCTEGSLDGEAVDFVDGVAFTPGDVVMTVGGFTDHAPRTSDYTHRHIYYRSLQASDRDWLTVADYLWRWDTDWFWCSRAFGAQHPVLRRMWPKRWLRSDVYWRMAAWDRKARLSERLDRVRGRPPREPVIQDVEIPVYRAEEFVREFDRLVGLRPVWLCPLRQRDAAGRWPLYPLDPRELHVNVGFWGTVPLAPGQAADWHDREVERLVATLGGHKSLYSTARYAPDEFWQRYGGTEYWALKGRYDPDGRFLDLYEKCVRGR